MKSGKLFGVLLVSLLLLQLAGAVTGSLGNSRMILRAETGEVVEKYVLVKNVNDVPVEIELFASGDLEGSIDLTEERFTLQAGEEKRAYFTIESNEVGTTESKINVKFTPEAGGNGVGLAATVILVASGENLPEEENIANEVAPEEEGDGFSFNPDNEPLEESVFDFEFNPVIVMFGSTIFLAIILVILFVFSVKKIKKEVKRGSGRSRE